MTWNKLCSVVVLSSVLAGCNPGIHRMWTVSQRDLGDEKHIQAGDRFAIVKTSGGAVIRPHGTLSNRWGFDEKLLTRVGNIYCVEVDMGPGHVAQDEGVDDHSLHTFQFIYPWLGNKSRVRVQYFPKDDEPCEETPFHAGVVHAQD